MNPEVVYTFKDIREVNFHPNVTRAFQRDLHSVTIDPIKFTTADIKYPLPCPATQIVRGQPVLLDTNKTLSRIHKFISIQVLNSNVSHHGGLHTSDHNVSKSHNLYEWDIAMFKPDISIALLRLLTSARARYFNPTKGIEELYALTRGALIEIPKISLSENGIIMEATVYVYNTSNI